MLNEQEDEEARGPSLFKIISVHINETDGNDKKHVVYTLQVRHAQKKDSLAAIDRRYTQFLNLYQGLYTEFSDSMSAVSFPGKALVGNFDNKLIAARIAAFESLLKHIMSNANLRSSKFLLDFLQEPELIKAKQYISTKQYSIAVPLLENNFTLLNNFYLDRSPQVLLALCRLLGCSYLIPGSPNSQKWANLALHRFDGVSDTDILVLYVPLLYICIKVWWQHGKDKAWLEQRLEAMKRQGMNCTDNVTLLEAVTNVEMKLAEY